MAATGQLKDRRKVIYSLFPSTISPVFKCRAGKSLRAAGELGWEQPGQPQLHMPMPRVTAGMQRDGHTPPSLLGAGTKHSPALNSSLPAGCSAQKLHQGMATKPLDEAPWERRFFLIPALRGWESPRRNFETFGVEASPSKGGDPASSNLSLARPGITKQQGQEWGENSSKQF